MSTALVFLPDLARCIRFEHTELLLAIRLMIVWGEFVLGRFCILDSFSYLLATKFDGRCRNDKESGSDESFALSTYFVITSMDKPNKRGGRPLYKN